MALADCRECGQQVSTEATTCPQCGTPDPTGKAGRCLGCGKDIRVNPGGICPLCGVKDPLTPYSETERGRKSQTSGPAGPRTKAHTRGPVIPWTLMIIGFGWALLGGGNIISMFGQTDSEGVLGFGLIFNMVLFVLPGLAIGGIGLRLHQRD